MGVHSYEEVMDTITVIDSLVLTVLILILFVAALCIVTWIKRKYIQHVRKEIERVRKEIEIKNQAGLRHNV